MAIVTKKMEWYIGTEWQMERKGLRKQVLDLNFTRLDKPHEVSKVLIKVEQVDNSNSQSSRILASEQLDKQQQLEMGTSLTPIDLYVELLVREMIVGERARCYIRLRNNEEISFNIQLEEILETKEIHKLTVKEMYQLALRYKENGVAMFKEYPIFAHDYFARAAKCLISYKPFEGLTAADDGMNGSDMQALFNLIQTNLAACLLLQKRYDDVLYQTKFVDTDPDPSEKSIFRRATAYYHIKEYELAQKTLEKVPNWQHKKEFANLNHKIVEDWKSSKDHYKHVVQRMFT